MINLRISDIRTWLFIIPQCVFYLFAKMGDAGYQETDERGK